MVKIIRTKEICLGQFLEGLNQATGGGRHMVHHHQDTRWFPLVALWETISKMCVTNVVDPLLTPVPRKFEKKSMVGYEADDKPHEELIV